MLFWLFLLEENFMQRSAKAELLDQKNLSHSETGQLFIPLMPQIRRLFIVKHFLK